MSQILIGMGLSIVLVVGFVLSYRHKAGSCTGTGDCGACHGDGHCSSGAGNEH